MDTTAVFKRTNMAVLVACILLVLAFSAHKHLYFDEAHYIMASKGITQLNVNHFDSLQSFTSTDLAKENTLGNLYTQGLYTVVQHYYTAIFGRSFNAHLSLSVLIGILIMIAFYRLAKEFFGDTLYTSLALIFFCTNMAIFNMTHDITPYIFSVFCVAMSAIYFFRYLYKSSTAANLLLLGIWSAFGLMAHLFVIYIIAVYIIALIATEKAAFFRKGNILPLLIPIVLLVVFYAPQALFLIKYSTDYRTHAVHTNVVINLSLSETVQLFFKSVAINFKAIFPLFKDTTMVRAGSFLFVIIIYLFGVRMLAYDKPVQRKYHLLFALGIISCLLLATLAITTNNRLLFSYRYFAFSTPFCCLFITVFIRGIISDQKLGILYKAALPALLIFPGLYEFTANRIHNTITPNNYVQTAQYIRQNNIHQISTPDAIDAAFINSLLPADYTMTYIMDHHSTNFILYRTNTAERIPVINNSIIELY